ncbi:MAG: hypothetical protein OHK0012_25340 [Synechococcales cyanobacterium]
MSLAFLQTHLGVWQGWFSECGPAGVVRGLKSSEIIFRLLAPEVIEQVNRYGEEHGHTDTEQTDAEQPEWGPAQRWVYTSLAAGLKFFADGSFSNGQIQLAPFSGFAVEQGFLWGDAKVRLVQQWDADGQVIQFTTIREARGSRPPQTPPPWQGDGLRGTWTGTATTYLADGWNPEQQAITGQWSDQGCSFVRDPTATYVYFPGQIVAIFPAQLPMPTRHRDRQFALHLGWLADDRHYFHLTRRYNSEGTWQDVRCALLERVTP